MRRSTSSSVRSAGSPAPSSASFCSTARRMSRGVMSRTSATWSSPLGTRVSSTRRSPDAVARHASQVADTGSPRSRREWRSSTSSRLLSLSSHVAGWPTSASGACPTSRPSASLT
jgi:hypothetical protein